ncbi:MAG: hypothetical protein AAGJ19_16865 [Myxococcota bacterium]
MPELSPWLLLFFANLALAGWIVAIMTWRYGEAVLRRTLAELPDEPVVSTVSTAVEVEEVDLDAADEGRPVELRARLRRSIEEVETALTQTSETSTKTSAQLMELLEKLGGVVASVARLAAEGELPEEFKAQANAITEQLREVDPVLGDALEKMDAIDAGLETIGSELARYGSGSDFDWSALRPSSAGLNRVLRKKSNGASGDDQGEDTSIPPALAQAIDEALI